MMQRMDILVGKERDGKTYWTRVGTMFPAKTGEGWSILLDVMPAPSDGQWRMIARPPKDRDDSPF